MRDEKGKPLSHPFSLVLLLVRHGETTWNAEGRLQGHRDVPLSETGRVQARRLAGRLSAAWQQRDKQPSTATALPGPPRLVFSSDLGRAMETAAILRDGAISPSAASSTVESHIPPARPTPLLRERGFGSWEGLTPAEARARFPGMEEPADGERWADAYARVRQALEMIWREAAATAAAALSEEDAAATPASTVALIVGHGGTLRAVLSLALGADVETVRRFHLDNVSLSIVEFRGETLEKSRGRILLVNDTAHLFFPTA